MAGGSRRSRRFSSSREWRAGIEKSERIARHGTAEVQVISLIASWIRVIAARCACVLEHGRIRRGRRSVAATRGTKVALHGFAPVAASDAAPTTFDRTIAMHALRGLFVFAPLLAAVAVGCAGAEPVDAESVDEGGDAISTQGGAISRTEMLARAQRWVDEHVMYSEDQSWTRSPTATATITGRFDCSGLRVDGVAPCPSSLDRVGLQHVFARQLEPEDPCSGATTICSTGRRAPQGVGYGHVVLFDKWANSSHTQMWIYQREPTTASPPSTSVGRRVVVPRERLRADSLQSCHRDERREHRQRKHRRLERVQRALRSQALLRRHRGSGDVRVGDDVERRREPPPDFE